MGITIPKEWLYNLEILLLIAIANHHFLLQKVTLKTSTIYT